MPKVIQNGLIMSMVRGVEPFLGSIVVGEDGRIEQVGSAVQIPEGATIIDARGCMVLPGFIDAHRHCWMSSTRGATGDMTLLDYVKYFRFGGMHLYRPEDIRAAAYVGVLDALNSGTTTMVDFAHCLNSPDHVAANMDAIQNGGARILYAVGFNDVPGKHGGFTSLQDRLDNFRTMLEREGRPELVSLWTSTSDIMDGADRMIAEVQASKDLGVPTTIHARAMDGEAFPSEVETISDAGLLHADILWAHMPRATIGELVKVRDSGGKIVSVPGSELKGGQGWPVIGRWRALGGHPAVGVSNCGNGLPDLFSNIMMGILIQRQFDREEASRQAGVEQNLVSIPMREAVEWITINAAEAVGLSHKIGTLEVGKDADIVMIRPDLFAKPVINPWTTIAFHTNPNHIDTVMVQGRIVKRDGLMLYDLVAAERDFMASCAYLAQHNEAMRGPFDQEARDCICSH